MGRYLSLQRVTVTGRATFTCDTCGRLDYGDRVSWTFEDCKTAMACKPGPSSMPIGWQSDLSSGKGDHLRFTCPDCIQSAKKTRRHTIP